MDNIKVGEITGASDLEKTMILQAIEYVKKVVFSNQFKDAVLSSNFTNNNGLTNQEIYDLFINTEITINVDDFYGSWVQNHVYHTEGYEQSDGFVHANKYFIDDALNMGSLILHEISHEPLGFHHDSPDELTSVPYTMNNIFFDVADKLGINNG